MEFMNERITDHLVPCTASENETCQIVTKLVTWKKLLLGSTFEIEEEADMSNQHSLTNFISEPQPAHSNDPQQLQQYSELLEWLLTTHRCIGSVSIKLSIDHNTSLSLLRSVCKNRGVRTLRIGDINASAMNSLASILPSLTNIEHLHLMTWWLDPDAYLPPLCALLRTSSSLRGLHLRGKITNEQTVGMLLSTFQIKPTLEELSFENLTLDWDPYRQALKEYLGSTTGLKVLTMSMSNLSLQMAVLEGVLENWSIEKLALRMFKATAGSTALVSRIIKEKRAMRSLSILTSHDQPLELPSVYDCWVTPLIDNDVLEEVTLPSSVLSTTRWSDFFWALPTKRNLQMVHIFSRSSYSHIQWLCAELKDSGAEEKVYLRYDSEFRENAELHHCKAIWEANLWSVTSSDRLLGALRQLLNCQHLKTLGIRIQSDHMRLSSALAEFLRSAKALHTLDLHIRGGGPQQAQGQNQWWHIILESICQGKSVKNLFVKMSSMTIQDSEDLADSIKHNTRMREVSFDSTPRVNNTAFFRRLSERIEENYTLASVAFSRGLDTDGISHWLAVKETTWRNSGLVPRAARIKRASQSDRYVTSAVDRVARYPALLDEVARRAKLDQAELEVLVRDRLAGIQSLDGFMRFVGVVKERVVCHPADDGCMQLNELSEDCWRHVRRYLVTDDIKIDAVQVDRV
ncbi:hypothetical protein HPB51_020073 [Rhipicephalus microplus]|uniref:Uncharacterized protein n=1 Tax=Rhipicephalus microplus TaxID=6941 RepID=A0A9J6EBH0_RHIMP|nr:hypothetical protein HPB51_020073 [Rhipicephalus microplus]